MKVFKYRDHLEIYNFESFKVIYHFINNYFLTEKLGYPNKYFYFIFHFNQNIIVFIKIQKILKNPKISYL
jgi:hypothetical protein